LALSVRRRSARLLLAAFDLAVPPMGLLTAGAVGGLVAAGVGALLGIWSGWLAIPWLLALLAVLVYVIGGLVASRAPARVFQALLYAPGLVLTKPLSLRRTLTFSSETWVRTERGSNEVDA
jgi:hypothetical protein